MDEIRRYIPLLIPVLLIELGLIIAALIDLARRPRTRGPKWLWLLIILLVNFIGPIIYFIFGRAEEE
jgi:phospholipase D-like protein